jgi:hypothetical protein
VKTRVVVAAVAVDLTPAVAAVAGAVVIEVAEGAVPDLGSVRTANTKITSRTLSLTSDA